MRIRLRDHTTPWFTLQCLAYMQLRTLPTLLSDPCVLCEQAGVAAWPTVQCETELIHE